MTRTDLKVKNISVTGLGYVGQTLAVTLAESGFLVFGTDTDENILNSLKRGESHIREPGIDALIKKHLGKNFFIESPSVGYSDEIDAFIICVSTPFNRKTGDPDTTAITKASNEIKNHLRPGNLVIMRSTLPIGSTRNLVKPILESGGLKVGKEINLVFAPERTIEGNALQELRTLPQIIGGFSECDVKKASCIFQQVTPMVIPVSSLEAAEAIKLLDNSFRDVKFAYSNEIAIYFEKAGLNALEVIQAANKSYPRNGIPLPSPGVGGACLSKDPYILTTSAKKVSAKLDLVAMAREINESIPEKIVERVDRILPVKNKRIFIAGFAFKGRPETNDMRESPTLDVVKALQKLQASIVGYDPCVENWKILSLGIDCAHHLVDGLKDADIVIFMINHKVFYDLDINIFKINLRPGTIIVDGWGLFEKKEIESLGFKYLGVGIG